MLRRLHLTRSHAILHLKGRLEQDSFPRVQMSLIVGLTGAAGLLFSFVMLDLGVTSMALRYPLALLLAYGVFLLLLWLWLRTKAEDYVDIPDLSGLVPSGSGDCAPAFEGGGGNFGGGGASGSFDGPASFAPVESDSSPLSEAASAGAVMGSDTITYTAPHFALTARAMSAYARARSRSAMSASKNKVRTRNPAWSFFRKFTTPVSACPVSSSR